MDPLYRQIAVKRCCEHFQSLLVTVDYYDVPIKSALKGYIKRQTNIYREEVRKYEPNK